MTSYPVGSVMARCLLEISQFLRIEFVEKTDVLTVEHVPV